ncbi:unnamed protein product, partial [Oppiella nova]
KRAVNSTKESKESTQPKTNSTDEAEEVHELLRVYLSREDVPPPESKAQSAQTPTQTTVGKVSSKVCVSQTRYYVLVTALTILTSILMVMSATVALVYFKRTKSATKQIDFVVPAQTNGNFYVNQYRTPQSLASHHKFDDPSEPIYTDPSLFERSRSLRSLTVSNSADVRSDQLSQLSHHLPDQ